MGGQNTTKVKGAFKPNQNSGGVKIFNKSPCMFHLLATTRDRYTKQHTKTLGLDVTTEGSVSADGTVEGAVSTGLKLGSSKNFGLLENDDY